MRKELLEKIIRYKKPNKFYLLGFYFSLYAWGLNYSTGKGFFLGVYLEFTQKVLFIFYFFCLIKKSSKKNQEQTIAHALCFFLYGQPFHLAALKKAITRIGTAFVRCHARVK